MYDSLIQNFDNLSFEHWLDFIFDEKWSSSKYEDFIDLSDLEADIEIFVRNCIKLFENPGFVSDKYSAKQLEGGLFYFILSPKVELNWWIWDKNNSPDLRRKFIFSSVNMFEHVFATNPLEHSCFMWWDCLRDFSEEKDLKVVDWMFETLSKILEIDSFVCQMSALHGLGHIGHSGKKDLIENFLLKHSDFADKDYALSAIDGNIL
ncbi:MAG: hypothetical protein ABJA66_10790 [Actinomycetota bacterium]